MLRTFAFEIVLFVLPFLGYMLWLLIRRGDAFDPRAWGGKPIAILLTTSLLTMLLGLALFGHFRGAPAGSVYIPAHLENGKFVAPQLK